MAAKEELLGALHEAVANDLLQRIQSGEATPAEISVAVKFLKDNGIEALAVENSPLANILDEMPKFTEVKGGLYGRN